MSTKIGLRLMLVDPDDDLRFLLQALLELGGCQVATAKNAREGLALIAAAPPDVIFTEIVLPDATGLDFGKQIRAILGARESLLVALTGHYYPGIRQDAWSAGFDRFLLKPVQYDQILNLLKLAAKTLHCRCDERHARSPAKVARAAAYAQEP